jgi:hypothetical protein
MLMHASELLFSVCGRARSMGDRKPALCEFANSTLRFLLDPNSVLFLCKTFSESL